MIEFTLKRSDSRKWNKNAFRKSCVFCFQNMILWL